MITGQDLHKSYRIVDKNAIQWSEVSPRARRLYEVLAQAIELEEEDVIVAVKCPSCGRMVSAYGYNEHKCADVVLWPHVKEKLKNG
jgi:hypothetical protein